MNAESSWVYVLPSLPPAFENMPMGFYKTESGIAGDIFCRKVFCKKVLSLDTLLCSIISEVFLTTFTKVAHRLNACVLPKFTWRNLIPRVIVLGVEALGRKLSH